MSSKSSVNRPYDVPEAEAPSAYQRDIYSGFKKPIFSTKPSEWESNYGYVYGSAGSGTTYAANLAAFDRYRLKPKMLVNATIRYVLFSIMKNSTLF
jgi:lactate 2-monooxygenase